MIPGNHGFILLHSPLVCTLTWSLVAEQMRRRGCDVFVPQLEDSPESKNPFWKQHAESVAQALANIPNNTSLTLVAHSGAGPLLPAIRTVLPHPIKAYVFVDAGVPRDGLSRLELMKSEDPEWADGLQRQLARGERFPTWSFDDLQEVIPDEGLRRQMVAELRPRGLDFFVEPIPVYNGWPDAPCIYIQFSAAYEQPAGQAQEAGWLTYRFEAGHFHMLVDPVVTSDMIVEALNASS